jgi:hypothetical protein
MKIKPVETYYHMNWKLELKYKFYAILCFFHLNFLFERYEQRKLDRAHRERFNAYWLKMGVKKINGKWVKIK